MERALNATGVPIAYSCSWPAYDEFAHVKPNYSAIADSCNLWRNWDDINDSWESVYSIIGWFGDNQDRLSPFHGPGHWNDPDMVRLRLFLWIFHKNLLFLSWLACDWKFWSESWSISSTNGNVVSHGYTIDHVSGSKHHPGLGTRYPFE